MRWRTWVAAGTGVMLVAVAGVAVWQARTPERRLVANFEKAVGIVEGSDVRVLGVKIGHVIAVKPHGKTVRVELGYDPTYDIPADAQAVVIPPSVVSDRYVQLTPAYTGGAKLADGAELPVSRTVVPLEIDDIYRSLDEFNKALGPDGANADGALSTLFATGRANLEGNGQNLHDTLDGLSKAMTTLSNGREDLFGGLANLQKFTTALAESDQQVRKFNSQLADVSEQLAGERDELAAALKSLAIALAQVTAFVRDNREQLRSNVEGLADVTGTLVRQQRAIIDILDITPLALSNLNLLYNPTSGTLDTRNNAMGPYDPASFVCSLMIDSLAATKVPPECFALAQTLHAHNMPMTDQLRRLLGLPPGAAPAAAAAPSGAPAAAPAQAPMPSGALASDPTLGGILRGKP
ncbi:MCE family protein [Planosporangium flavigriseum]|uniref:ABC transporter substrate-binding protein n=1 Tax=Planosporangium flavigriseum TaxID=373681 RepID=A0A8J3LJB5_9ACTN|nr:MCE family protein [Planosporangium flavigriseum]GIG71630.1 ABC transporter substrate-binding protein [Planosporangium flavigriseum]